VCVMLGWGWSHGEGWGGARGAIWWGGRRVQAGGKGKGCSRKFVWDVEMRARVHFSVTLSQFIWEVILHKNMTGDLPTLVIYTKIWNMNHKILPHERQKSFTQKHRVRMRQEINVASKIWRTLPSRWRPTGIAVNNFRCERASKS